MPAVLPGEGTLFQIKISTTFTTIARVTEGSFGSMVEAIEKTVLTDALILYRPSKLPESDKLTLKMYFDPNDSTGGQGLLAGDSVAPGTIRDFQIQFVDGNTTKATAAFSGFVSKFSVSGMKVKDNVTADVEITPTTIITFTAGTP